MKHRLHGWLRHQPGGIHGAISARDVQRCAALARKIFNSRWSKASTTTHTQSVRWCTQYGACEAMARTTSAWFARAHTLSAVEPSLAGVAGSALSVHTGHAVIAKQTHSTAQHQPSLQQTLNHFRVAYVDDMRVNEGRVCVRAWRDRGGRQGTAGSAVCC